MNSKSIEKFKKRLTTKEKKLVDNYRKVFFKGMSMRDKSMFDYWLKSDNFLPNIKFKLKNMIQGKNFWRSFMDDAELLDTIKRLEEENEAKKLQNM